MAFTQRGQYVSPILQLGIVLSVVATVHAELPTNPDLDELKAIAAKPHSDKLALDELRIYPNARLYTIKATMHRPKRDPDSIEMPCAEKWVDGKYIVSTFTFPGAPEPTTMIVTFDKAAKCYRKWVFSSSALSDTMLGTRAGKSRSVAWGSVPNEKNPHFVVGHESHTDTTTEWSDLHIQDGEVVRRIVGKATTVD
jgi:hypothetical protein